MPLVLVHWCSAAGAGAHDIRHIVAKMVSLVTMYTRGLAPGATSGVVVRLGVLAADEVFAALKLTGTTSTVGDGNRKAKGTWLTV